MRILIADDEPLARARMAALVGACPGHSVVGSAADGEAALALVASTEPDVLLLDIAMPGLDGLALARRLAQRGTPRIIFTTAYDAHALEAFELDAVDYLLKPVRLERLREALDRATRRLAPASADAGPWLHGRLAGKEVRVAAGDVIALLAEEKYVLVHHVGGELLIEQSLRQIEDAWSDTVIRLHRNCLVPKARLIGLETLADGRTQARLAGSPLAPEISRRNLAAVRKLLRMDQERGHP